MYCLSHKLYYTISNSSKSNITQKTVTTFGQMNRKMRQMQRYKIASLYIPAYGQWLIEQRVTFYMYPVKLKYIYNIWICVEATHFLY